MKRLVLAFVLGLVAASLPAEAALKVTLRWKAADGSGNYGYLVYRSKSRQGPYLRINAEIVHTPQDGAKEHEYVYEDLQVEPGATYYYYLDTIDTAGVKKRFSGVLPKTVPGRSS
jgi:hypothetical protein